ncbi:CopG family transcriptional regulator [Streptomyces buecherae]|uniref:CopG family transcriptional regulator n=1 Tax=Streptomyces buecherae TaxID=2763006 RepID=UPI00368A7AAD
MVRAAPRADVSDTGLVACAVYVDAAQIKRDNLNDLITVAEAEHGPVTDEELQALCDQLHQARDNQTAGGANTA